MKRSAFCLLSALALLATACMQDNPAPMNDPDIPLVSVDNETMTRISATLTGSFEKAEGIVSYGFEMTGTNFDSEPETVIEVNGLDAQGNFNYTAEVKPGAFYAVRSYISDGHNKKYSKELTLKVPQTSVATPSDVSVTGSRLLARIVDDGGRTIREVGFCWGETPDIPTLRQRRIEGEWVDGVTFAADLPPMEAGHTYYFLSYAENSSGAADAFGYSRNPCSYLMTDEFFVDIEDEAFLSYLLGRFDENRDGRLTNKELMVATDIAVSTDQVASVQGIEWMPLLASLDCRGSAPGKGRLTSVDVSRNPLLSTFLCDNNRIGELDLSGQPRLTVLTCSGNLLTELDLRASEELSRLDCSGNRIANLDVSNCFRLTELDCSDNALADLDLTRLPYLRRLFFRGNPLETVDISYCTELETLDGTGCGQLMWVFVSLEQYGTVSDSDSYKIDDSAAFYPIFVPIKDDNLYGYLISVYDRDGDRRISAREAESVTRIEICTGEVKTMAGIEFFYNLEELICASCQEQLPGLLTELDVSRNRKLTYLDCHGNRIEVLDLSRNRMLSTLICGGNGLTDLDVSGLPLLSYLECGNNRLSDIDVSRNSLLKELYFGQNAVSSVDLSHCLVLGALDCSSNELTELDVSGLAGLTELKCSHNQLEVLDITQNIRLTTLWCEDNQLGYLDVTSNPRLADIRCDNVYFPDEAFKAYLVKQYDSDADAEISLAEAWKITRIEVDTRGIYSVEGIQSLPNLQTLICGGGIAEYEEDEDQDEYGGLKTLDVSKNTLLDTLDCRYNHIGSLDLSNNRNLLVLTCIGNEISYLDVGGLSLLGHLDCADNPIKSLDLSHNPLLFFLQCQYTGITELDVSANPLLRELYCSVNELYELDLKNNTELSRLDCRWNNLEELDVSNNPKLQFLNVQNNNLSSIDVSGNPLLNYLNCRGNPDFYELFLKEGQEIETLLLDTMDIEFIYI
ncbi:MAG: hypothetical protein K6G79_01620 [Bacteroidales bacterium]|nr:hypothetical protein [Bacteroidales bacterium]